MARPAWLRENEAHLWLPYTQMKTASGPLPVVSTEGVRIRLADGRELVDGIASWWTACHGYRHPRITAAVAAQLERLPHVMLGGLAHEPACVLAGRLAALLPDPLEHVFFSESGSVSVEIAMKMAIQYWINRGERGRFRLASFPGGYHGDTIGAMSVGDPDEGMHALFHGLLPEQVLCPLPRDPDDLEGLRACLREHASECAALIIEPLVQGAGGMRMHEPEVLAALVGVAREHGLLVIFDEIFTGFGRTGTMFACEQADVTPDIVTLSKGLSGGVLPLAATVASREVYEGFLRESPEAALMHGPTYMGNPLACAAANASLDLFESEPRLAQIAAIERQLSSELAPCEKAPGVVDVRVKGAIGVVQLDAPERIGGLRERFVERGVWIRPFADIVYLTPAFTISSQDLRLLTQAICEELGG